MYPPSRVRLTLKRQRRPKVIICELFCFFFLNVTRSRSYRHTGRVCRAALPLAFHVSVHENSNTYFYLDTCTVLRKTPPEDDV